MKITKIELLIAKGWVTALCQNNTYTYEDLTVSIQNGAVKLQGSATPVFKLRIVFESHISADTLILGDAWERGYGDLAWKAPDEKRIMPWYFLAFKNSKVCGYGVKTQPDAMCFWTCTAENITLTADVRSGTNGLVLKNRELNVCTLVSEEYTDDIYTACKKFCELMCDNPRFPETPVFGGNDWYCNYGDNSFEKILLHTKRIAECAKGLNHKPYMVIDDGWEICHYRGNTDDEYYNGGPWKIPNRAFGKMAQMAQAISDCGVIPGIWYRPLLTIEKIPPHMVLHKQDMWRFMDPSDDDVLAQVKEDISRLKAWGYKLIKHDFSTVDIFGQYGNLMNDELYAKDVNFSDSEKTTAQIIKNFYKTIREVAGEDVLIMGCNTLSHLAAGYVDIQRTGDDTSGFDWNRTRHYGINTLAFRMNQHNTFYCVDADCVGITDKIDFEKNRQWLDVLAKSGTPVFVSIAENCFNDEVKSEIAKAFGYVDKNPKTSRPLDWIEDSTPTKWESDFGICEYNW